MIRLALTGKEQGLSSTTRSSDRWITSICLDSTGVSCLWINNSKLVSSVIMFRNVYGLILWLSVFCFVTFLLTSEFGKPYALEVSVSQKLVDGKRNTKTLIVSHMKTDLAMTWTNWNEVQLYWTRNSSLGIASKCPELLNEPPHATCYRMAHLPSTAAYDQFKGRN